MLIVRLQISNFRCIEAAEFFPSKHNVLLAPNNTGKTAVLEAISLLLNPEGPWEIDENDFYRRTYLTTRHSGTGRDSAGDTHRTSDTGNPGQEESSPIRIEAVLADLTSEEQELFRANLVPWDAERRCVVELSEDEEDPFAKHVPSIRVVFEGWYEKEEDGFASRTFFLRSPGIDKEYCDQLTRRHKRQIGFLIYRDFRGLTRPITLERGRLFARLLESQESLPHRFEEVLGRMQGSMDPLLADADFSQLLGAYKSEIERYLPLSTSAPSSITFEFTDRTRSRLKEEMQMHVWDELFVPVQNTGAGTRSLAVLSMLTLLMRRRQHGILAMEEPETFLFPHAQRRVVDECVTLASQTFVTTHSPYILERMPLDGVTRMSRDRGGKLCFHPISPTTVKEGNLYFRKLRQTFSEALLGRGVLIVEGDSDKRWVNGASRIMNRTAYNGRLQEALELLGVAVVAADANSDIPKLGRFFLDAGLRTIGLADNTDDSALMQDYCAAPFPVILFRQEGLEELLSEALPLALIRQIVAEAPDSRIPLLDEAGIANMTDRAMRNQCFSILRGNKGTASLHEWILARLEVGTVPEQLKTIVDKVAAFVEGSQDFGTHSLLS